MTSPSMTEILVLYYSRHGAVRDMARAIALEQDRSNRPWRAALIGLLALIAVALLAHWRGAF